MWLENHRDMILTFYDEFGETTTKTTFNLKGETLHNLLATRTSQQKFGRLSKADKAPAQAEILRADLLEIRKDVKCLYITRGRFDAIALMWFSSTEQLFKFMEKDVGKLEGVKATETFICLHVEKSF